MWRLHDVHVVSCGGKCVSIASGNVRWLLDEPVHSFRHGRYV